MMPTMPDSRLFPAPNTAAIRCYNQGLGDCFLLAFPRLGQPKNPFYVVIDCGVAKGTPDEAERMQQIVKDIASATGNHVDVLAVTHEHYDHVIGFVHAEDTWKTIHVDRVYLPWTEIPGDPDAEAVGKKALRLSQAVDQAVKRANRVAHVTPGTALQVTDGLLTAGGESFGIETAKGMGAGEGTGITKGIEKGMKFASGLGEKGQVVYCEPGDVHRLADTGVKAYVLGPPRPAVRARKPARDNGDTAGPSVESGKPLIYLLEDPKEMYSYEDLGLTPDGARPGGHAPTRRVALYAETLGGEGTALAAALLADDSSALDSQEDFDRTCPFDATLQLRWDDMAMHPFFWEHYISGSEWRRMDFDWLDSASDLALRAGGYTNNISLVLAFELPASDPNKGNVLLFVGDAQVGNWLSWQQIDRWRPANGAALSQPPTVDELLKHVTFYKVGHHGSHNATPSKNGLEKLGDDLVAFIPVSVPVAQDIMGYCPMPYYPVLRALQHKTRGAVFLGNGLLLEPPPEGADRKEIAKRANVSVSSERLPDKVRRKGEQPIENEVPLWTQFVVANSSSSPTSTEIRSRTASRRRTVVRMPPAAPPTPSVTEPPATVEVR